MMLIIQVADEVLQNGDEYVQYFVMNYAVKAEQLAAVSFGMKNKGCEYCNGEA